MITSVYQLSKKPVMRLRLGTFSRFMLTDPRKSREAPLFSGGGAAIGGGALQLLGTNPPGEFGGRSAWGEVGDVLVSIILPLSKNQGALLAQWLALGTRGRLTRQ